MKMVFVSWDRFQRRSELLADHLGAALHTIHVGQSGRMWQAPARYALQTLQTWRVLGRDRPDIILVQNPPIFAVLAVYLYARRTGARFAIDSHTGAFLGGRWRWSVGLHRHLSRRAAVTIVHNTAQEALVREWGCAHAVIGFTPGCYPDTGAFALPDGYSVAVISTYKEDEPLAMVFEAARRLPDVAFFFTGNSRRIPAALRAQQPPNCHLTGYLPYDDYVALLRGADAIMDLTTRNETLLMGGFEAVSLGTPLITSDWPVLRDYFHAGTVHVPNTVEGICAGVRRAQVEGVDLRAGMCQLRDELTAGWQQQLAALKPLLEGANRARNNGGQA